tara:strand:- start:63 stop:266 length:204 start_codon:yes stop_codon:yes gene_type:complete
MSWLALFLLASACVSGCVTVQAARPPSCPIPSEPAIDQTIDLDGTPLAIYLGEIERYCAGVEALRGA